MATFFFTSDLHGSLDKYNLLLAAIRLHRPEAVFLGGDLLPGELLSLASSEPVHRDFLNSFLGPAIQRMRNEMGGDAPEIFVILGNDDPRFEEAAVMDLASRGLWTYVHGRICDFGRYRVLGYSYVPPTPFRLKDWERYDVSRYVDPGCISPEEGQRTVPVSSNEARFSTIHDDLAAITGGEDTSDLLCLFHSPPYRSRLDRAALDGRFVDHVPLDVHIGSIAIQRYIIDRQPLITMHGHVHESTRLTGAWSEQSGRTWMFSGCHDGPELSLVRFDPERPSEAVRDLIQ